MLAQLLREKCSFVSTLPRSKPAPSTLGMTPVRTPAQKGSSHLLIPVISYQFPCSFPRPGHGAELVLGAGHSHAQSENPGTVMLLWENMEILSMH